MGVAKAARLLGLTERSVRCLGDESTLTRDTDQVR